MSSLRLQPVAQFPAHRVVPTISPVQSPTSGSRLSTHPAYGCPQTRPCLRRADFERSPARSAVLPRTARMVAHPIPLRFPRPQLPRFPRKDEPARRKIHARSLTPGPVRRRDSLYGCPHNSPRFHGHPVVTHLMDRFGATSPHIAVRRCRFGELTPVARNNLARPACSPRRFRRCAPARSAIRCAVARASNPPTGAPNPQSPACRAPLPVSPVGFPPDEPQST